MKIRLLAIWGILAAATLAQAEDELAVYVSGNGAAQGVVVILDSDVEKTVDEQGLLYFDLTEGAHSLQFRKDGERLYSLRFDAAQNQMVDVNVDLSDPENPQSSVERYFAAEGAAEKAGAPTGAISGEISFGAGPVIGAQVSLRGTNATATTDSSGQYRLEAPRGIYQMRVQSAEFGERLVDDVRVISNLERQYSLALNPVQTERGAIEEVTVVATMGGSMMESERFSVNVVNTLGAEQLTRFGDTDIAAAVLRAPSITVQDDQFIFIRGLGGRYVTTTLNGATLPSTDPTRRTVPLDLFPTNVVEQLDIRKTFIASMPGESTGGNLVINTRTFPSEREGKLSFSIGYVDGITGETVYVDPLDGDYDWLGWDDGTRDNDDLVKAISEALEYEDYYPDNVENELRRVGALDIYDNFDLDRESTTPDLSLGLSYGDVGYLDSMDGELGFYIAGNYKNEWNQRADYTVRTFSGQNAARIENDYRGERASNEISLSGLISVGFNIGNTTLEANTLVSRVTESQTNYLTGSDGDALLSAIEWNAEWEERQFISQQLAGEHLLGEANEWTIDWQATASQATRYAPDRRDVRFLLEESDDIYNLEVPELTRQFDDLTDDNIDVSADVDYQFYAAGLESTLSFGAKLISRERDSDQETYGFIGGITLDDNAPNLSTEDVVSPATITGNPGTGYGLEEKTLASDRYDAEMDLNAVYVSYDAMWQQSYQFILGARYEEYEQITDTFSLAGEQLPVQGVIDEDDVLPTLSFNWFITDDQQLRFAVSETVGRPDFKETANATFFDDIIGARVRGNPNLKPFEVSNYDLRWEKYWSDVEMVSVALFYKDLTDPIERVVQDASGTVSNTRTFQNSEEAEVWGVEVDFRKDFALNDSLTKTAFVAFNASVLDTEVTLEDEANRELQGAPDYTANLVLGYDDIVNGHELTILFNQVGESIFDVGVSDQPNVIEEPRLVIDVNYKYELTEDLTLKTKLKNLLDSEVELTQGGRTYQSWKKGWEFSAGVDWRF